MTNKTDLDGLWKQKRFKDEKNIRFLLKKHPNFWGFNELPGFQWTSRVCWLCNYLLLPVGWFLFLVNGYTVRKLTIGTWKRPLGKGKTSTNYLRFRECIYLEPKWLLFRLEKTLCWRIQSPKQRTNGFQEYIEGYVIFEYWNWAVTKTLAILLHVGHDTTSLHSDYFISHEIRIPSSPNRDFMKSHVSVLFQKFLIVPIGSMGLVYLATNLPQKSTIVNHSCR